MPGNKATGDLEPPEVASDVMLFCSRTWSTFTME